MSGSGLMQPSEVGVRLMYGEYALRMQMKSEEC